VRESRGMLGRDIKKGPPAVLVEFKGGVYSMSVFIL